MLKSYFPVVVFMVLGGGVGTVFTLANSALGPRRPNVVKREPYECGLPSEVTRNFRFGISFYLIAMLFILFDIEVIFLYPVAVQLRAFGTFALVETIVFIVLLAVAFVYVWRRGAVEGGGGGRRGPTRGAPRFPPRPEALMHGIIKLRAKVLGDPDQGWRDRYRARGTEELIDAPLPGEGEPPADSVFLPGDTAGA